MALFIYFKVHVVLSFVGKSCSPSLLLELLQYSSKLLERAQARTNAANTIICAPKLLVEFCCNKN